MRELWRQQRVTYSVRKLHKHVALVMVEHLLKDI